ncbi:hypothetical protein MCFN_00450 [Mycoplasmopsis californica]|uniref:ABM domain-containing protein n=1 Tax=Mycoplasmopsis californica TaxID=2113 RepID=A0A059XR80_9BACT|nr:antibiotic biosynthesis monooxygenase [Mycoplasmopsis californica]AIA29263.1 hypothetical protein MCFN_00450 [Mycoplasmopsis californica]
MICVVTKEIKIKKESRKDFTEYIKKWMYLSKQQELNLSMDGFWISDRFSIIERWSSEDSFHKFTKTAEYKDFLNQIEQFGIGEIKIKKYKTLI